MSLAGQISACPRRRSQDPPPYELDWAAVLDEQPRPPGERVHASAWAATYAREHAARIVVPVDDGYLIGFGGGEYGGSLWWYPREPGSGRKLAQVVVHSIIATPESGTYVVLSGLCSFTGLRRGLAASRSL